jgi:hypothetical protein
MWALARQIKLLFKTWEQKILRKIYDPIKDKMEGESELTMLCITYRKPTTVTSIKIRKPELAGHLVRMYDDRAVNKVFMGKTDG